MGNSTILPLQIKFYNLKLECGTFVPFLSPLAVRVITQTLSTCAYDVFDLTIDRLLSFFFTLILALNVSCFI